MEPFTEINTDQIRRPSHVENDLFSNRRAIAGMYRQYAAAEVSIIVAGFNRLEKTRRCVESILTYTSDADYELILVDSGSEDGTLEYFRSVQCAKKKVIHITQNLGVAYAYSSFSLNELGDYICFATNDLIVTKNWMSNLLACMKSDSRIGMVTPMTSNSSNLQSVDFPYQSYEDMQRIAADFNHSDPRKWEDRQRLIVLGALFRKEALLAKGWPVSDVGFFHDFVDDDEAFTIRRLGYRTVLAGDTWICHDHDVRGGEGKNMEEFRRSLETGRKNFQEKHFGVDAWEDVNNFYIPYLEHFPTPSVQGNAKILGVDTRCGTPVLDVKNWLRKHSVFDAEISAFTQDPKYWLDLKTICAGPVLCDREEYLGGSFPQEQFDYVICDRPLNRYHEPQKILNDLFALCKPGGVVACKLKNTFSFQEYFHLLGQPGGYDPELAYHMPAGAVHSALSRLGSVKRVISIPFSLDEGRRQTLEALLPAGLSAGQKNELLAKMMCRESLFIVSKLETR